MLLLYILYFLYVVLCLKCIITTKYGHNSQQTLLNMYYLLNTEIMCLVTKINTSFYLWLNRTVIWRTNCRYSTSNYYFIVTNSVHVGLYFALWYSLFLIFIVLWIPVYGSQLGIRQSAEYRSFINIINVMLFVPSDNNFMTLMSHQLIIHFIDVWILCSCLLQVGWIFRHLTLTVSLYRHDNPITNHVAVSMCRVFNGFRTLCSKFKISGNM